MTDEQFDTLLKAVKEISSVIVIGILGIGVIIAMIGLIIIELLR